MSKFFGHDTPFEVYIAPLDNRDELGGEWVRFPTTPEHIAEIFQRLGIGPSDWSIANTNSHIYGIDHILRDCEDLDELNYLAAKLDELSSDDVDRFAVMVETDKHCGSMEELINLCDNLECYDFLEGITDYDELARHYMRENPSLDNNTIDELEDYIDFEQYGREAVKEEKGVFTDNCYVVPNGAEFHSGYVGRTADIPDCYLVTTKIQVPLLTDEQRVAMAAELAGMLDAFFRTHDPGYADLFPNTDLQVISLTETLVDGKIADIDARLTKIAQQGQDASFFELETYKAGIRYDPENDAARKWTVLAVDPLKAPWTAQIEPATFFDDAIRVLQPFEDPVVLIHFTGDKYAGELNRALYDEQGHISQVIPGSFVIAGKAHNGFASLSEEMLAKYADRFRTIEVFAQVGDRTVMFQVPQDNVTVVPDKPSVLGRLNAAKEIVAKQPTVPEQHKNEQSL